MLYYIYIEGKENTNNKTKGGDKLNQEAFERHKKTVELMQQVNGEVQKMDMAEFTIYVNAVEIPHTKVLQNKTKLFEKEGNENEKS